MVDINKYPNFKNSRPYKFYLEEGDILFIPSLCVHYVECLEASITVNIFYKVLVKIWL